MSLNGTKWIQVDHQDNMNNLNDVQELNLNDHITLKVFGQSLYLQTREMQYST